MAMAVHASLPSHYHSVSLPSAHRSYWSHGSPTVGAVQWRKLQVLSQTMHVSDPQMHILEKRASKTKTI